MLYICRARESKSDAEVIVKSDMAVVDAARSAGNAASTAAPTTATPIAESLKMVTKQLLQSPSATDMVATDVRTPPRVKSQVKTGEVTTTTTTTTTAAAYDFVPYNGKGEAHPILLDDNSAYEIITAAAVQQKVTTDKPTSVAGLSTWILLSNGEQSTLATKKTTVMPKKKPQISTTTSQPFKRTEEPVKVGKPGIVKPVPAPIRKANITREEPQKVSSLVLQDSKFKNRTPVVVGRIPSIEKLEGDGTTVAPASTTMDLKKRITAEIVPTTSLLLETDTVEAAAEESTTTESTTTTTKRTRRPTNKKKKKNKNRRRRPATKNDTDTAESKITEENTELNKIDTNRPISTRIYNYLAREVMPSVGVGLVGVLLTAGLAGLFLYPFGGGIARRNYDKATNPMSDSQLYYYNSYTPHAAEMETNNAQPEEKIFGQVLSSMNQNTFSPSPTYDTAKFTAGNHKFRYDLHDYNVNGYAGGANDYSTLPDSVKNVDYTASDTSKYYSMDPVSTHYKLTDNQPHIQTDLNNNYPSLTEYTSYTNAAAVGTVNPASDKNATNFEDKSNKSQPQFSALVGSAPHFTNTDFVGSVSLTGSYGTQEVNHRSGILAASDLGPRSLHRAKRDVHDDFNNEIDSTDEKLLRKPMIELSTIRNKIDTTTTTELPIDITTTEQSITDTTIITENETNKDTNEQITTQHTNNDEGFLGFLRRLAQMKLKLGMSLLKSTGQAFQRYLGLMARRMETAIRNMETQRSSTTTTSEPTTNTWTAISTTSREKRNTRPLNPKFVKFE